MSENIKKSTLYLVPTPIGNFLDMTFRSIDVLKDVDVIFCEDTRVTKVLLSHFNISTRLLSYHIFNEDEKSDEIINLLRDGKSIALVSDAGLPCISDPGFLVSKKAILEGFDVISLPGANAALTALIASGLPCEKFMFYGFLNHKTSQKEKELKELINNKQTTVFYEAPHRIKETIDLMYKVFGKREVVIARELTKKYEEYIRSDLETLSNQDLDLKGEIVIVLKGTDITKQSFDLNSKTIQEHYNFYLKETSDDKQAMKMVARDRGISKSEVYKIIIGNNS